jgi:hypothetical protein
MPIVRAGKASTVIAWNGVHDYKNDPHSLVNAGIPELVPAHSAETLLIVQVGKPVGVKGRSVKVIILAQPHKGPIVLWTRDQATYDSAVKELRSAAQPLPCHCDAFGSSTGGLKDRQQVKIKALQVEHGAAPDVEVSEGASLPSRSSFWLQSGFRVAARFQNDSGSSFRETETINSARALVRGRRCHYGNAAPGAAASGIKHGALARPIANGGRRTRAKPR